MATTYVVTGRSAVFGPGMVLCLTRAQVIVRIQSLAPREEGIPRPDEFIVTVLEPIEFKAGERVTVVEGAVSKVALTALTPEEGDSEKEPDQPSADDSGSDTGGPDNAAPHPKGSGRG